MSALLQAWLVAWLFALGVSLGAMANLMVLALTSRAWAAPAIPAWIAAARALPWIALGFIPVALAHSWIYPWAARPTAWLNAFGFVARGIAYLVAWSVLSRAFLRAFERGVPRATAWAAAGLIVYGITVSLAAFDWIASLTPAWASSGFGLLVATGQMLAAAAYAVARSGFGVSEPFEAPLRRGFHDLGNLLLMYVLTWAYLAYTQFLVIWSENLPREISWYVPRLQTGWSAVGLAIVVLHFALPFAILLSRRAKRAPRFLAAVAALLLAANLLQTAWLVVPSVSGALHG